MHIAFGDDRLFFYFMMVYNTHQVHSGEIMPNTSLGCVVARIESIIYDESRVIFFGKISSPAGTC